ncbi:cation diffusion facilitator CzcD-associated flavoprotein CzcO [Streptosporangium becharense]|uniref:Cation diffusion facilitator CzcD-associated flavoprotein CzcO n=1 Tax=Streptosporangium becharense TaxID=1816182 RepID=A0A7W9IEH5_9ACTN|nr:NAD(P)/FAD-dependent oxidoreductase [Streptosporangium becharense]MBB2909843.1 cation diffusion facilitator CzcD-associated flavoprotein CzcO [Streptosporangium becharense]MBB5819202.1 cation diffusion facilitator CzcD-associated flavoprotein CzcO [Streptosporangium becharense]
MTTRPGITIIGSGFAGLGMAIKLKEAGYHDFVILEKAAEIGGTWRDNTYPGCACDIPSHMYSFSYELNPGWSRMFSPRAEIWRYMRDCVDKYGLAPHLRLGSEFVEMAYDDAARDWKVRLAGGETLTSNAVVAGIGALHVPSYPEIPGRESFRGPAFHSAGWDHSVDLTGKRVAVIGTGASAVQFVPEIAGRVARLHLFQRTPPWIHPKPDFPFSPRARRLLRLPGAARTLRNAIYWVLETRALGFTVDPRLMRAHQEAALRHLTRQVPDPVLRAKLTPDYTIGCKRVLISNDYYPALCRDDVEVITDGVREIRENSIVDSTGRETPIDVIIYGTGFRVTDALGEQRITGRAGRTIQEAWRDGVEAYHGVVTAGFPNLFFLLGPNTGLGHNSVVFMIESQVRYVIECLRLLSRTGARALDVRSQAQRHYNDRLRRRLERLVWNEGGCRSWYLDEHGVNRTLWPGFTFEYWARTRKVKPEAYELIH